MKTKALLLICSILAGGSSYGEPSSPSPPPNALVIVVDTSWSSDRYMGDFLTLSRQAALTLRPGDYLEIIAAQPGNPAIKLAQTVKTGSAEEIKSIDAALATVRAQFLSTASIANALETVYERLEEICSKRSIAGVTTICFTDGQMGGDDVKRVLALADKARERGWRLFITGTKRTTADLLVAANKGRLTWSLIAEADPGLWFGMVAEGPAAKTVGVKRRRFTSGLKSILRRVWSGLSKPALCVSTNWLRLPNV